MKKQLKYIGILFFFLYSCEEIYVPNLDSVDNFLIVEGRFISDQEINKVVLYRSENFNTEALSYPRVNGAKVFFISDSGDQIEAVESERGGEYFINTILDNNVGYHLKIEVLGETYESSIQVVPEMPHLDSIYGKLSSNTYVNQQNEVVTDPGYKIFVDIANQGGLKNYRFFGRKIIQFLHYTEPVDPMAVSEPVYNWKSYSPTGIFNIAGPAEYSTEYNIIKHPLEFYAKDTRGLMDDNQFFAGWIYIIDQFGISEDTYGYYDDLNKQLDSEGKIFDPIYVQAEGNIKCTSNPDVKVFGNFEIASHKESRFYVFYYLTGDKLIVKQIPYYYNIPMSGSITGYQPDFWEHTNKVYP